MREISLSSIPHYSYCNHPAPTKSAWMVNLAWDLLCSSQLPHSLEMVIGMPKSVIEEAMNLAEDWVGWGFYSIKTSSSKTGSIPVLLFKQKEDAMLASLRWPGANWEFD